MSWANAVHSTTQRRLQQRDQQFAELVHTWHTLRLTLDLDTLFTAIVEAAHRSLGFEVVLLNVVDHDHDIVRVRALAGLDAAGQEALADAVYAWQDFAQLMQPRFQIAHCFFIPAGSFDWADSFAGPSYVGPALHRDAAVVEVAAWQPDDALFVPIELRDGTIVGILSVDQPLDGLRPSSETLQVLDIFSAQAAVAIENARLYARAQQELAERNAALHALTHAKAQADQANRAKSVFLATMSHELRTPLTTIIGYSELLQRTVHGGNPAQVIADLARIATAGTHLLGIINNILDLSKIEAGHVDLVPSTIVVDLLIKDVVQTLQPRFTERGNKLYVHCAPDVGTISSDATRLRQIVLNVVANAAKFTNHGTIIISVERVPATVGEHLIVRVSDTGIGMNAEQLARLFHPFTQVHASPERIGGNGLGLALSQQLAQLLGGMITVVSSPGHGSTFTIRVSTDIALRASADAAPAPDDL